MPENDQLASLQIDRGEEGRRRIWPSVLILAIVVATVAAVAWFLLLRPRTPEVRTAVAREVSVDQEATVLNASGYVTARRQATISSKVTGRVLEVLIEEGMEVEEGQIMARLDDSNARVSLGLAEAELAAARSALNETEVRRAEAEVDLSRIKELVERNVVSEAELDRAQAAFDSLVARIEQQQTQIEVAAQRVAVWQQEIDDRTIRAPYDGVVVSKNAQPGEMISPLSAGGAFTRTGIATVVDMSSLEIEVDVNESYINRVRAGQAVEATLDAYSDWQIPAHVIAIVPTADRQRATVRVRIGFEELDPRILPDMGVKVAFRETAVQPSEAPAGAGQPVTTRPGVIVPPGAIRKDGSRDIVFVVRDDTVERRAVTLGDPVDQDVVVMSGLAPGEAVVVDGPPDLADGDLVRVANQ
jgi:RND family efflux transporter MFP subunit